MTTDKDLGLCLVTGAAGFLGRNLVRGLLAQGYRVRALVNRTPLAITHPNLDIVTGNICDAAKMREVMQGVNTVFHSAAQIALMGGRFTRKKYEQQATAVNVDGTKNLVEAAQTAGTTRFVYTSSIDTCFDGSSLPAMDESLPYAASPKCVYSKTKIAAEQYVLSQNGVDGLYTCAIRPDGIWGAEPNDLIDRIASMIRGGQLKVRIGDPKTLQDNSHVKNLVHAELLAAARLGDDGIASGKAYFISDGEPMNSMEFFRPLIEGLGQAFPQKVLGTGLLRLVAHSGQAAHFLLGLPEPFLTPHELDKVSVTHYGSNALAEKELGYQPVVSYAEGMQQCVDYLQNGTAYENFDLA